MAASAYACPRFERKMDPLRENAIPWVWPWDDSYWKPTPKDRIRELAKAGALTGTEGAGDGQDAAGEAETDPGLRLTGLLDRQAPCPNCGAPMTFQFAGARAQVCKGCSFVVARTDRGLQAQGKMADLLDIPTPLKPGVQGSWNGEPFLFVRKT